MKIFNKFLTGKTHFLSTEIKLLSSLFWIIHYFDIFSKIVL